MKLNIRKLEIKTDDRGWLAEIFKPEFIGTDKLGQVFVTVAKPGKTKGGHYHLRKREWFCVIAGKGLLTFSDIKTGEILGEIEIGEKNMSVVEMPLGSKHSIKNIGRTDMYLLVYISEPFNPQDPDTYYE